MTGHKELAGAGSNAVKTINCGIANFDMPTCAHYYKSIMSRQLPARVEKMELAELVSGGTRLTGTLPIKKLPRLKPLVTNDKGAVDTRIEFFQNRNGLPAVRGGVDTALELVCQRCLKPVRIPVTSRFCLVLVTKEDEADSLDTKTEPWIIKGDFLDLNKLVEEEVMLAMPGNPVHDELEKCGELAGRLKDYAPGTEDKVGTHFGQLKDLLSDSSSGEK